MKESLEPTFRVYSGVPRPQSHYTRFPRWPLFLSRVDTAVDRLLAEDSPLRGKVAVANAKMAYQVFRKLFAGPQWERLAAAGGRVQRPLWASTGTKNPAYSDVLYIEELVGPTP